MSRIFITGATGFLGAHIAQGLLKQNDVLALKRSDSDTGKWKDAPSLPVWIDMDGEWQAKVVAFKPDVIIHAAWIGVEASGRNEWEGQLKNLDFLHSMMRVAGDSGAKKFIALGSQAEYGNISGMVAEDFPLAPTTAYGAVKVAASQILRTFCEQQHIDWYWLRLFSFFGEGENDNWFIPSLIRKLTEKHRVDLTPGMQQYAYLYVKDLGGIIEKINKVKGQSGIYNISAPDTIRLKELGEKIRIYLGAEGSLNWGSLPYRPDQPMLVQGDSRKFRDQIGDFEITPFEEALIRTVDYYREKFKS